MYNGFGKRLIDLVLSSLLFVILLPIFFVIALLVRIDSKGPAIYKQLRVGKGQSLFNIYKFRTMVAGADQIGPLSTQRGDRRITRVGRVLRKTSLDELPQLLNVIKGDMSIVGPRPDVPSNVKNYDPARMRKFEVQPGITGYAQVYGRSDLSTEEKMKLELEYVNGVSFHLDFAIIVKTFRKLLGDKSSY